MLGKVAHLTVNPILGHSTATYIGRNDAAISLALDLFRGRQALDIAVLGGGIYEPLTLAASSLLPQNVRVAAYDNSPMVTSALNGLLQPDHLDHNEWASHRSQRGMDSDLFQAPSSDVITGLRRVGVNTELLWDSTGRWAIHKRIRATLRVYDRDAVRLPTEWSQKGHLWDLIVCINLLPNLSIKLGANVIAPLLAQLWEHVRPGGIALIGTLNSHFYASDGHPSHLTHFSAEMFKSLSATPWSLLGWLDRAFVREAYESSTLLDGYMYFFLGKRSVDFSRHLDALHGARRRLVVPHGSKQVCLMPDETWQSTRYRHVYAAVRSGAHYSVAQSGRPFPCSVEALLARVSGPDIRTDFCEQLLLPSLIR